MAEISERLRLKFDYRKAIELATIITMALLITLFQAFKRFEGVRVAPKGPNVVIKVEEVPLTEQVKRPPPPQRPSVPIPTESEDVPEDLTIESTEIDWKETPPPPPPPESGEETPIFIPYDSPPEPIGGWGALRKNLVYPEIAKKAGVEGKVIIWAKIDKKGKVIKTQVMKSLGNVGCDEAAIAAIAKTRWKPAMQRDKPVTVWVAIPVDFRLKDVK